MDDRFFQFYPCKVCRAMVSGPHACSPLALGRIEFERNAMTEERIRAIVREELAKLMAGNR